MFIFDFFTCNDSFYSVDEFNAHSLSNYNVSQSSGIYSLLPISFYLLFSIIFYLFKVISDLMATLVGFMGIILLLAKRKFNISLVSILVSFCKMPQLLYILKYKIKV
jgi:hypothetical protein